ncbi:hypothetical protein AXG93_884s1000 [Marchantia polymorpha subsp. ruderalis]|uniref:CASP-like protein n=1 Tax=Marchantia polymorpha subsp. ruderalis TaxID=1480154 RepID=A0A176WL45_MARPO|nr:hypothetical protein AXG93_884s1000 [Marchantia polymorpha subsp. ruderalis]
MDMIFAFLRLGFAAIFVTLASGSLSFAEDAPLTIIVHPGQSTAEVQQILDFATRTGRPVEIEVGQADAAKVTVTAPPAASAAVPTPASSPAVTAPAAAIPVSAVATAAAPAPSAPAPAPMTPTPEMMATDMGMAKWSQFSAAFMRGAITALSGVGGLPKAMAMADDKLVEEGSSHGRVLMIALATICAAAAATLILRRLFAVAFSGNAATRSRAGGIVGQSLKRMIGDLLSIAFFLLATRLALDMIGTPGMATERMVRPIAPCALHGFAPSFASSSKGDDRCAP